MKPLHLDVSGTNTSVCRYLDVARGLCLDDDEEWQPVSCVWQKLSKHKYICTDCVDRVLN